MEKRFSWKFTSSPDIRKFSAFYGNRRCITFFTTAHHVSLCWTRWIQSRPFHPISLRIHFNIIIPSMPRSFKWSLYFSFPRKIPYTVFLFTPCVPRAPPTSCSLTCASEQLLTAALCGTASMLTPTVGTDQDALPTALTPTVGTDQDALPTALTQQSYEAAHCPDDEAQSHRASALQRNWRRHKNAGACEHTPPSCETVNWQRNKRQQCVQALSHSPSGRTSNAQRLSVPVSDRFRWIT
jgi:hypothetical protein